LATNGYWNGNGMKKIRASLMAVPFGFAALAASVVVPATSASAKCDDAPVGPAISVPVPQDAPGQFDQKLTSVSHPSSGFFSVNVPAGPYTVVQGSIDPSHPNQEDQPNERWYAVFYAANGSAVGTTAITPDLALADVSKTWPATAIVLTGNAKSVKYFHAGGSPGPDSIYPSLLQLSPSGKYPPEPCDDGDKDKDKDKDKEKDKKDKPGDGGTKDVVTDPIRVDTPRSVAVPVVVVLAAVESAPIPVAAAPAPAAATPAPAPRVEVQGIQIENAAPAAVANVAAAEVAFTGAQSLMMAAAALGMIGVGAVALGAARKRKTAK
jgi:hypothetical protein